ncbi:hypothetical protein RB195_013380 [Necator americanus]|uniref:Uncharacterized protein n=1 Tax=Necator americanus TaxID=51031 RepID=A0ABR1DVX2_NECAM
MRLAKLTTEVAKKPETWQSITEIIDSVEQITTAQANAHAHRYVIDQNITAAISTTPERIASVLDHLHQFYISFPRTEHHFKAATAACAEASIILHLLFTRLRRNRAVCSRSSTHSKKRDEQEWQASTTAPSTSTTGVSTTSAPAHTTLTTSRKSSSSSTISIYTISISSTSPGPSLKRHKAH